MTDIISVDFQKGAFDNQANTFSDLPSLATITFIDDTAINSLGNLAFARTVIIIVIIPKVPSVDSSAYNGYMSCTSVRINGQTTWN